MITIDFSLFWHRRDYYLLYCINWQKIFILLRYDIIIDRINYIEIRFIQVSYHIYFDLKTYHQYAQVILVSFNIIVPYPYKIESFIQFFSNIPIQLFCDIFSDIYGSMRRCPLLWKQHNYLVPLIFQQAILYFLAILGTNRHRVALTYVSQTSSKHICKKG